MPPNSRKESLAEDVLEAHELELGRQIGVDTLLAQMLVMFDMVTL